MKIWVIISRMRVVAWMSRVAAAIWRFVVLHYSKRRLDTDSKHDARKTKALCAPSSPVAPLEPVGVTPTLVKLDSGVCSLIPRTATPVAAAADVQSLTLDDYEAAAGMRLMHSWGKDTPAKCNAELLDKYNAVLAHKLSGRSLLVKEEDTVSEAPTASTDNSSVADNEEMKEVDDEVEPRSESEIEGGEEYGHNQDNRDEANSTGDSDGGGDSTEVEYVGLQHQFDGSDTGTKMDSEESATEEGDDESECEIDPEADADIAEPDAELESRLSVITEVGDDETSNNVCSDEPMNFECFEKGQEPAESSDKVEKGPDTTEPEDVVLVETARQRGTDVAKYICHFEASKPDQTVSSQSSIQLVRRAARWECVGYGRYVKCTPDQRAEPEVLTMATRSVHWMRVGHCRYDKYFVGGDGTLTPAHGTRTSEEGSSG